MRCIIAILFIHLLFEGFCQPFQYKSQEKIKSTWGTIGGGVGGTGSYNMPAFYSSVTHTVNHHVFDFKYQFLEEHDNSYTWFYNDAPYPPDWASVFNLEYGFGYTSKYFACNLTAGAGIIFGKREMHMTLEEVAELEAQMWPVFPQESAKYKYESFCNLNIPIDIDAQLILANKFGLEVNGFIEINREILTGGVMFGVVFGQLR